MKTNLITILLVAFINSLLLAQNENASIQEVGVRIGKIETENARLREQQRESKLSIKRFEIELSYAIDSINYLKNELSKTNSNLQNIANNLGFQIQKTNEKSNTDISSLNKTLSNNTLYWIVVILIIFLMFIILFHLQKRQFVKDKSNIIDKIKEISETLGKEQIILGEQLNKEKSNLIDLMKKIENTLHGDQIILQNQLNEEKNNIMSFINSTESSLRKEQIAFGEQFNEEKNNIMTHINKSENILREEQIKIDEQLIKLLNAHMLLIKECISNSPDKMEKADHLLVLKVLSEITNIQKKLSSISPETKELKQFTTTIKRIQENFETNGYELVDMIGKPFSEDINASVVFKTDANLKQGEKIITKVIIPQINFKGSVVQTAKIEVSEGE
ncbi:MAG: hypothetical protein A2X12_08465 [Bacteroidetes bacterium GWE2_29_8]|nr:MAG: hypothetical protein A2X12_08465 [Bacteroidetes bacterium GWE2_29_8]OFY22577.1 MAG: hypothetical protein A2X02_02310 [Bacteroidetes bacterium GWF2_29_10]